MFLNSHLEGERLEDTSINNRNTGGQGHQSAGAKTKAMPPASAGRDLPPSPRGGAVSYVTVFFSSFFLI